MQNSTLHLRHIIRSLISAAIVLLMMVFPAGRPVFAICVPGATSGNNVITCDGADDTIDALAGNDQVNGGTGNDSITGGAGNDTLTGGAGDDTLIGGTGNDSFVFNTDTPLGTDSVTEASGGGTDAIDFSGSNNAVVVNLATLGNQTVNSNLTLNLTAAQVENITSGNGDDTLTGNALVNVFSGGNGNDILDGAAGNDTLTGGAGNDTYIFTGSVLGTDIINEAANADSDTLDFSAFTPTGTPSVTINLASTNQTINTGDLSLRLQFNTSIENVIGSAGADVITGNARDNLFTGGAGNDTLTGGAGNDTLNGGADNDSYAFNTNTALGTDTITDAAGSGTDTLNFTGSTNAVTVNLGNSLSQVVNTNLSIILGTSEIENVTGGTGNDVLSGNGLNNTIIGGNGNNTITGAGGDNTLTGGTGADVFVFDTDNPLGRDVVNGGSGTDRLDFSGSSTSVTVDLGTTTIDQIINSNLILRQSAVENVTGGSGNDTLTGSTVANTLLGGDGNDILSGGSGNIVDILNGGNGTDRVVQTVNANQILTNTSLTGAGTDQLVSIEEAILTGGASNNIFTMSGWTGTATIDGSGGTADTIVSSNDAGFVLTNTSLTRSTGSVFTLSNIEQATLTGGNGNNILDASAFTSGLVTLSGGNGNDTLNGGSGNDILDGGAGNDALNGGAGTDRVVQTVNANQTLTNTSLTGAGSDTLTSMEAATLTGGASNNIFTVSGWTGTAIIDGAGGTADAIVSSNDANFVLANTSLTRSSGGMFTLANLESATLTGGTGNNSFTVSGWTGTTTIDGAGGTTDTIVSSNDADFVLTNASLTRSSGGGFTLANVERATLIGGNGNNVLNASAFSSGIVTLSGGNGDDTLSGGSQNDSLTGGAGNDILTGGAGNDTLDGSAGNDTYIFAGSVLGSDIINEAANADSDTLDFSAFTPGSPMGITINLAIANPTIQTVNAGDLSLRLQTITSIENVVGSADADTITGNTRDNVLSGGNGDDTLTGAAGNDTLNGEFGNDFLSGGDGDDALYGGNNDDNLDGGSGNDSLEGGAGNDTLTTSPGVDTVDGGADDDLMIVSGTHTAGDTVDGGTGTNIFRFNAGTTGIIQLISNGNDTLDFSLFGMPVTIDLSNSSEQDAGGGLLLTLSGLFETVYGSIFDDVITGNTGDNMISGGDGHDTLTGGDGNDALDGGSGDDILDGGAGADTLDGEADTDTVQNYSTSDTHANIENGFPTPATTSPTQAGTSVPTPVFIPVTGGIPIILTCESNPVLVKTQDNNLGSFYNLCGYTVVLDEIVLTEPQIDFPNDGTYLNGLSITLIKESEGINEFPEGSLVNLSLPIAPDPDKTITGFFWDITADNGKGAWVEVPIVVVDGSAQLNVMNSGSYIITVK